MMRVYAKYYINKNNVCFQEEDNVCLNNEWNAIDDIGKVFKGRKLTEQIYSETENGYIKVLRYLMDINGVGALRVAEFCSYENDHADKYKTLYNDKLLEFKESLSEGDVIDKNKIDKVVRLLLRTDIWCRLYAQKKHFIVIPSSDFYMYVICKRLDEKNADAVAKIMKIRFEG